MRKMLQSGFTLLELLAVMAVMAIMTTLGAMGYFAASKGSAQRGTLEHLTQAISFARQTAIMDGRRVYVVFGPTTDDDWFAVCKEDGALTYYSSGVIGDEFADWSGFVGASNMVIFNLTGPNQIQTGVVIKVSEQMLNLRGTLMKLVVMQVRPAWTFSGPDQLYGWEVLPRRALARGLAFRKAYPPIIFEPDGSSEDGAEIVIREKTTRRPVIGVYVTAGTGFVSGTLTPEG